MILKGIGGKTNVNVFFSRFFKKSLGQRKHVSFTYKNTLIEKRYALFDSLYPMYFHISMRSVYAAANFFLKKSRKKYGSIS